MSDNSIVTRKLGELEKRTYAGFLKPEYAHLIEHVIRRDRILYFMFQLHRFWYREPWDLPPRYDGYVYSAPSIEFMPLSRLENLHVIHEILTGLEAEVVLAAQRRGIPLKLRPCDEPPPQPRRRGVREELSR